MSNEGPFYQDKNQVCVDCWLEDEVKRLQTERKELARDAWDAGVADEDFEEWWEKYVEIRD